ncbi:MAG: hypothetical protein KF760_26110 [Candidatus Eremiobacteraeota bacterium]|nr:hypothetical protein [Candidatus Eremiobacteraeota bacterium]MCW5869677.1 hypothetical protein [Candidatus Eremiobacteraeota bacterium]
MAINPNLPSIQSTGPVRNLNHLSPVKSSKAPQENHEVPGDQVNLRLPGHEPAAAPQKKSSSWLRQVGLAATFSTLAIAGTVAGTNLIMAGMSPAQADSAHVQVVKQTKTAPTTLLQEQQAPTHLLTARIGVTPSVHDVGKLGKIETDKRIEAKPGPNGTELTHDIRIDRLSGTADGHVLYSSDDAELGTLDFHDQAEGNWKTTSVIKGAGHYGKYISVSETTTRFTGGTEATEVKLRTIDSQTHKEINLSELVSSEDYVKMADAITSGLNNPAGLHYQQPDMESLDSHMNNGFSLREAKDGSVILTVAIPSSVESDGGKVAEFTFSLPASAIHK